LKALIYSIRNLYDVEVFRGKVVNLSLMHKLTNKNTERGVLKLEKEEDFYNFHKTLLPLNSCKTKFEFNRKNAQRAEQKK